MSPAILPIWWIAVFCFSNGYWSHFWFDKKKKMHKTQSQKTTAIYIYIYKGKCLSREFLLISSYSSTPNPEWLWNAILWPHHFHHISYTFKAFSHFHLKLFSISFLWCLCVGEIRLFSPISPGRYRTRILSVDSETVLDPLSIDSLRYCEKCMVPEIWAKKKVRKGESMGFPYTEYRKEIFFFCHG